MNISRTDLSFGRVVIICKTVFLILAVSYNQPKFCPSATWNPNATDFANISTVGSFPRGIFVDSNNTVYVADHQMVEFRFG